MAGRIITLQRQARELGRLRTGLTDGNRPVRSETWIVTSHAEHYVEAAAAEWGGTAEKWQPQGSGAAQFRVITQATCLDAILPPGDPLSQSYEMWSRGGCQRRCDGMTEQLTDAPCLCIAQFGESWYEQEKGDVCSAHTRLNVILPQMPDIGVWRMETGSFYAANEIAAHVDLIRNATGGNIAVPIRLRMEQRQRVAAGKTKKFPVVAVELRGSTAGQLMAGTANLDAIAALPGAQASPAALEAGPKRTEADWLALTQSATTLDEVRALWRQAGEEGTRTEAVATAMQTKSAQLQPSPEPSADPDEVWQRIVMACPQGWTLNDLELDFHEWSKGKEPGDADAATLNEYLAKVTGAAVATA
jgi:hypothetical protein